MGVLHLHLLHLCSTSTINNITLQLCPPSHFRRGRQIISAITRRQLIAAAAAISLSPLDGKALAGERVHHPPIYPSDSASVLKNHATNFVEITNRGYWNTYTNTCEQSFQDQDLNEFQHREPQFDDLQNYYPLQQQTTNDQPDLVSIIGEFMKSTQASFRNMEIQLEEMTLKLKSESLENIPDEIGNGYIKENLGEVCGEKQFPCPENSVDMREIEITKTVEHDESEKAIELNHEDTSEQEKEEMDVMIEDILIVDHVVDLNVDLKTSIVVDEKANVFEVEVIRRLEIFVYRFEGAADEHPILASYRLITTKKDYKLRWILTYCNAIHALVEIEVIELMGGCAIYKALDWT